MPDFFQKGRRGWQSNMISRNNSEITISSTKSSHYTQKIDLHLPWAFKLMAFQVFIMAFFLSPFPLHAAYTMYQGTDVEIQGNYAYVAVTGASHSATDVIFISPPGPDLPSGLRVIDISDPDSPEIVGGLNYSNSGILCLTVAGDLAYLAYSGTEGVKIIDISDPKTPEIIGTIKNVYAMEIVIRNGYAYIADPELGLVIYDVSDPAAPVKAASLSLNGSAQDIAVQGNFAYLSFENNNSLTEECGLHICNISDPKNPFLIKKFVIGTSFTSDISPGGQVKVWLKGNYAYWTKGASNVIVDVSDPANPSKKGMVWILPGLSPYGHVPSTNDITGSGDYLYMIASGQEGQEKLFVVDISAPLDPDPLGDVTTYKAKAVAVYGDYACIAGWDGFQIIDISDPDAPSVAGSIKSTQTGGKSVTTGYGYGYPYGYGFPNYPGYGYGLSPGYGYPGGYSLYGFGRPYGYGISYPGYGYGYPIGASGGYGYSPTGYGLGNPDYGFGYSPPAYGYRLGQTGYGYGYPGYGYPGAYSGTGFSLPGYSFGYPGYGFGLPGYGYGFGYTGYPYPGGYGPGGVIGSDGIDYTSVYDRLWAINAATKPPGWY